MRDPRDPPPHSAVVFRVLVEGPPAVRTPVAADEDGRPVRVLVLEAAVDLVGELANQELELVDRPLAPVELVQEDRLLPLVVVEGPPTRLNEVDLLPGHRVPYTMTLAGLGGAPENMDKNRALERGIRFQKLVKSIDPGVVLDDEGGMFLGYLLECGTGSD